MPKLFHILQLTGLSYKVKSILLILHVHCGPMWLVYVYF